MSDESKKKQDINSFTLDSDETGADMPSVTRLLNRKSLNLQVPKPPSGGPPKNLPPKPDSAKSGKQHGASKPTNSTEQAAKAEQNNQAKEDGNGFSEVNISPESLTMTASQSGSSTALDAADEAPQVQPASSLRSEQNPSTPIIVWDRDDLVNGADPIGKGLMHLFRKGATSALFMAIVAGPEGAIAPHFTAKAALGSNEKFGVWTGLTWDPAIVPELWNAFVKSGWVELTPPGTTTNIKSARNVVRAAFGVERDERLLLMRAGPAKGCRGILAVISKESLQASITVAMSFVALPFGK